MLVFLAPGSVMNGHVLGAMSTLGHQRAPGPMWEVDVKTVTVYREKGPWEFGSFEHWMPRWD